jgi:hypothetical protein
MDRLFINREWLVSPTAQKVYLLCACFGAAFVLLFAYGIYANVHGSKLFFEAVPAVRPLVKLVFQAGLLGAVTLEFAMAYFWRNFDREQSVWKSVAGLLLLATAPVGTILYYVFFYRSSVTKQQLAAAAHSSQ